MADNTKDEEQTAAKPAQGQSKLIPLMLVMNTLLMGGVLAIVLLRKPGAAVESPVAAHGQAAASGASDGKGNKGDGAKAGGEGAGHNDNAAADPSGTPGPILKLDNFIIQLRGTDTDRYVRVAFDLELVIQ